VTVEGSEATGAAVDPAFVRARALRLAMGVVVPFARMARRLMVGFGLAAVAGLVVGLATREPLWAAVVAFDVSLLAALIAWWPFFDPTFRGAAELFYDHDARERAEWMAETGTPLPRGLKASERWLNEHPTAPGRASLLLVVGRIEEADRAIDAGKTDTPTAIFDAALLRQTRRLLTGDAPDMGLLHDRWSEIPDPRVRGHRRECIALLDAEVAVVDGRDPIEVLAAGRQEVGEIPRAMRIPWLLARWSVIALVLIGTATLVTVVYAG
jgi:hypothetical protein